MKKTGAIGFLVVLAIMASATTVSAQWGRYDTFGGYGQQVAVYPDDPRVYGGSYPMPQGVGYGDPCAAFLVQAQGDGMTPLVYGGIAAAGTRAVTRNQRWVAGAGALGAIVGAIKNSRDKRNGREALAVCQQYLATQRQGSGSLQGEPYYQPSPQPSQRYEVPRTNYERSEPTMPAPLLPAPLKSGPPAQADYQADQLGSQERCMAEGMETLKNGSSYPMPLRRIYDDGRVQELLVLMPNASVCGDSVPADKAWHYEGLAKVNVNGGISAEGDDLRTQATTEFGRVFAIGFPGGWMLQPPPRFEREDIVR
jgi:hypothetical protein